MWHFGCLQNVPIPSQFYLQFKTRSSPKTYFFLQSTQQEILIPPIPKAPKVVECLNSTSLFFLTNVSASQKIPLTFIISSSLLSFEVGVPHPTFMHWWFQLCCYLKILQRLPIILCPDKTQVSMLVWSGPQSTSVILFCNSWWSSINHTGCLSEPQICPFFFLTSELLCFLFFSFCHNPATSHSLDLKLKFIFF